MKTTSTSYRLDIYRMGYYGGNGRSEGRNASIRPRLPQPAGLSEPKQHRTDRLRQLDADGVLGGADAPRCLGSISPSWSAPTAPPASHIVFIVRNDASTRTCSSRPPTPPGRPTTTTAATACTSGSPAGRAYKVSYNRPFDTNAETPEDFVFNAEYPMVRFLEANGYDVSYTTGVDTDRRGADLITQPQDLPVGRPRRVLVGRPAGQRRGGPRRRGQSRVLQRQRGVLEDPLGEQHRRLGHAATARWSPTRRPTPTPRSTRTTRDWTGTWRDPRFSPPADGGRPENGLTGTIFTVNCCTTDMDVDGADGKMRFWRNTRVASSWRRNRPRSAIGILGYEWDEDARQRLPAGRA